MCFVIGRRNGSNKMVFSLPPPQIHAWLVILASLSKMEFSSMSQAVTFTLFSPLGKLAGRDIYFACINFFFFLIFTARGYAKRGICLRRVSVCVCVSVTLRYCIKTAKRRITQTTPHDSPMILVFWTFWCQRSWRNSNGITPYGGDNAGGVG